MTLILSKHLLFISIYTLIYSLGKYVHLYVFPVNSGTIFLSELNCQLLPKPKVTIFLTSEIGTRERREWKNGEEKYVEV